MALHLGQYMAIYLAETITGLLQRVLTRPAKGLVNETNAALLTQKFWVQAVYTELLYASSRFRAVREKEQQRPPNGLVKVVCLPFDGAAEQKHGRKKATDARFETMIGPISWVDSLFIWFPAAWMPLVVEAIREKSLMHIESTRQLGAVAFTDQQQPVLTGTQEFSFKVKRWQVDQSGCCPILQSRINVDWFTFDPQIFTTPFHRLYDGILYAVFIQKAAVAWDNAPNSRIMVSLLLPGPMEADQWLHKVRANRHMWPLQMTSHPAANQLPTELFMRRERRRLQARHIWVAIKPDWPMIKARVWTKHATGLPYTVLHRRLFLHEFTEESRWLENPYKGPDEHRVKWQWKSCRDWFSAQATAQFPSRWVSTLYFQRLDQQDVLSWQWVDYHERIVVQVYMAHQAGSLST